jgi:hypothetical protein
MSNLRERFEFLMPFSKNEVNGGQSRIVHQFDLRIEGVGYWNEEGDIEEPKTLCNYDIDGIYLNLPKQVGKENIKAVVEYFLDGFEFTGIGNATHAHVLGYTFNKQYEALLDKHGELDRFTNEND